MRTLLKRLAVPVALFGIAAALALSEEPKSFYLRSGDTVVFYGDSITDQRLYTMLAELYAVTRYPNVKVTFVHSGWGGDRVTGGSGGPIDIRLDRDVFTYKPTVMTIMLGMNDGNYTNHKSIDDEAYYTGYRHIIESVRQKIPGLRITAIEPSPYDDVTRPLTLQPGGYNAVLTGYGQWIRHYASEANLNVADLNTGVVQMLQKANASDPALAQKIIPDRVHPALAGHLIMAEQLLKSWNARPIVSAVTIDAAHGKVAHTEHTRISGFRAGSSFEWTELDDALPLPFTALLASDRDHTLALAIQSSDVTDALNQEPLSISGLSPGRYKLTIDGQSAGTWSDKEFARGVNLAVLDTPMSRQAAEVRDLTVRHIDIHQARWRTLQVPLQKLNVEHVDEALKALDTLEGEVIARQWAAAQPHSHVFQVVPAT